MNILILQQSMGMGGVNVVSAALACKFSEMGHQVDVFAFYEGRNDMPRQGYANVPIHIGHGFNVCKENVVMLHELLVSRGIRLVINQWGLPYQPTEVLRRACKGTKARWVSYYHNDPMFNGRVSEIEMAMSGEKQPLKKLLLKLKLKLVRWVTGWMMAHNYRKCWRFVLLSESYVSHFRQFTGLKHADKLMVVTNPVTIDASGYMLDVHQKEKEILFVGRLDPVSKKVSRLVEAWSLLESIFPDWRLTIVGEGAERGRLEKMIVKSRLSHVTLVGLQPPRKYYERASVIALTSDFEGLPLILGEAMTFGTIPVVYDSFDAIHDIVDDGVDGVIVPRLDGGFLVSRMAEGLRIVMADENRRFSMMEHAKEKSKAFSMDTIYKKWERVFKMVEDEQQGTIS